jgi:hypothetical protein
LLDGGLGGHPNKDTLQNQTLNESVETIETNTAQAKKQSKTEYKKIISLLLDSESEGEEGLDKR